jgi:flagellin-like hook-associated protein FlgL
MSTATTTSATLVAPTTLMVNNPTIVTTGINADTDALSVGRYTVQLTHGTHTSGTASEVSDPDNRVWTSTGGWSIITSELATGDYTVQSRDSDPSATTATWQYRLVDSGGTVVGPDWTTYTWGTNPFNTGRGLRYGMIDPTPYPKNTSAISETVIHYTHSSDSPDALKLLDSGSNSVKIASNINGTGAGTSAGIVVNGTLGSTVNFGNGLIVDLEALVSGASGSAQINYTTTTGDGEYHVKTQGANGVALDDTSGGRTVAGNYRQLLSYLDGKLNTINSVMSKIGAFTGRLEFKEEQVSASQINVEASYNRIMNANMAEEQVNASKFQILQQTAISMLAQANQAPASLLTLFR